MGNPYQIVAKGEAETDVLVYGDIGGWGEDSVHAAKFVKDLAAVKAATINLRINSFGGAVSDALAIHNSLRSHTAKKHTYVEGVAVSAASLIAMAGDTVTMHEGSIMMIHGPSGIVMGSAPDMRQLADVLDKFAESMLPIYVRQTAGMTSKEAIKGMLTDGKDYWYTPAEAVEAGFADEIIPAREEESTSAHSNGWMAKYEVPFKIAAQWRPSRTSMSKTTASAAAQDDTSGTDKAKKDDELVSQHATIARTREDHAIDAKQIAEAETTRGLMIRQHVEDVGLDMKLADNLIRDHVPLDVAREKILAALAGRTSDVNIQSAAAIHLVEDERDKFVNGAGDWILAKAGLSDKVFKATGKRPNPGEFRGLSMTDLARMSLERQGRSTKGMDKMKLVGEAFTFRAAGAGSFGQTTSDFAVLLENTMHKSLMAGWAITPDTWRGFAAVSSVSDFRPHNRYRTGSFGALETVLEDGEFRNKPIPSGIKELISIITKGNIVALSRQAIINDDMGVFNGIGTGMGRSARLSIELDVFLALLSNSGMGPILASDGLTVFHASHNNISASAGPPTIANVEADRVKMAGQLDISGNEILDIKPSVWLGPASLRGQATVTNNDQYDTDGATARFQKSNISRGLYSTIIDTARLPAVVWYSFADPSVEPVLEVAFLDGTEEPFLETREGWRVDGVEWKVRLDYGIAGVGFRGAIKNAGV